MAEVAAAIAIAGDTVAAAVGDADQEEARRQRRTRSVPVVVESGRAVPRRRLPQQPRHHPPTSFGPLQLVCVLSLFVTSRAARWRVSSFSFSSSSSPPSSRRGRRTERRRRLLRPPPEGASASLVAVALLARVVAPPLRWHPWVCVSWPDITTAVPVESGDDSPSLSVLLSLSEQSYRLAIVATNFYISFVESIALRRAT